MCVFVFEKDFVHDDNPSLHRNNEYVHGCELVARLGLT